ncbi:UPF0389 protein GA21628 [Linepithema humile]|uniref:UPF0389 protein GA21628 n=1 Tax=Linepithema humile TaxID=83485 RepID=UPI000623336F|nr:PREDICTED: protein FAM162A-like [Linepithema humile]XP_012225373.1 PREDICTED: protein FAM162A-like [Linepithema humile]XP_012225374.1 PREDICTED: protein FAM162A-like [Linepithema humile]XP_012225375.1 PREDICTED: protein FAM162A-like [Linepithema humile]
MLPRQFVYNTRLRTITRWFTHSTIKRETNKMDKIPTQKSAENIKETDGIIGTRMHRVTDFDKRVLVWVKRYPSIADVPKDVTVECLLTARSKARIKACNYMIIGTLIGCVIAVILGKRQAARGETLSKQREDWFNEMMAKEKNK